MINKTFQRLLFVLITTFVASCSNKVKSTLGLTTSGPDEYSVGTNKPLEMPPHFTLKEIMNNKEKNGFTSKVSDNENLSEEHIELLKEIE